MDHQEDACMDHPRFSHLSLNPRWHSPTDIIMLSSGYEESGDCMLSSSRVRRLTAVVLIGIALFCGTVTAGTLTYAIGDKVDLSGTAYTTNTMYLFVTGPGLDPNGVNPGQMKSPVVTGDPSTFVQVDVENDTWYYIWNTAHQGFSLKEGTYTFYAVSQPVAKNALPSVYGSIEIILSQGEVSVPASGTVSITTSPPGAAVYIDSRSWEMPREFYSSLSAIIPSGSRVRGIVPSSSHCR